MQLRKIDLWMGNGNAEPQGKGQAESESPRKSRCELSVRWYDMVPAHRKLTLCTNWKVVYRWGDRIEIVHKKQDSCISLISRELRCVQHAKRSMVHKGLWSTKLSTEPHKYIDIDIVIRYTREVLFEHNKNP
jgi:hypothetical protein